MSVIIPLKMFVTNSVFTPNVSMVQNVQFLEIIRLLQLMMDQDLVFCYDMCVNSLLQLIFLEFPCVCCSFLIISVVIF